MTWKGRKGGIVADLNGTFLLLKINSLIMLQYYTLPQFFTVRFMNPLPSSTALIDRFGRKVD